MSIFGRCKQEKSISRQFTGPGAVAARIGALIAVLFGTTIYTTEAMAVCHPLRAIPAVSKATVNEVGDSVALQIKGSCTNTNGSNIVVSWAITGSAVNGTDYEPVIATGTATIVKGSNVTVATIVPIDNSIRDMGRTVKVHLTGKVSGAGSLGADATATIIDDDTPRVSVTATDAAAGEAGPDTGTYTVALDRNTGLSETIAYTMGGDAANGTDYSLSGGTASADITQTTDADFNAGDTSGGTSVTNDSVEILPASSTYSLPDETNLAGQSQHLLGVGGSASDRGLNPLIVQLGSGAYRVYYSWHNGTYWQLAYRDTTDTNPPTSANLGAQTLLGVGTSATDAAAYPTAIESLPGGGYRLYYAHNAGYWELAYRDTTDTNLPDETNLGAEVLLGIGGAYHAGTPRPQPLPGGGYRLYYSTYAGGSYWQLAYRDTTDTNLPDETNLGAEVLLGIGGAYHAGTPRPQPLPGGGYRLYYSTYAGGSYWQLAYRDTTDTNLPDETNLGAEVLLGVGGTSNHALGSTIYPLPGGGYRYYYARNAGFWQLAYRDTTDANLPDTTNLGAEVLLGVGSSTSDQALTVNILQLASGQNRLYYDYHNGSGYWQLAYRDAAPVNTYNTAGVFTSSVLDLGADSAGATTLNYTATEPTNTTLSVDVRAGNSVTPPTGWTGWQTVADGGSLAAFAGNRYVQYRATLDTTDTAVTPTLDDLAITHDLSTPVVVSGTDITLPAGSSRGTVILTPIDDSADEYDEVATLTIGSIAGTSGTIPGTPASASVTIADDDLPEVNVVVASDGAEEGGTPGSFTVSRTGILDAPLTVNYTVGGTATPTTDYSALSGTVTLPAGSGVGTNSATVSFTPVNDAAIEGTEDVSVTLSVDAAYVIGAANTASANIVDNDTDGSSRPDASGIFLQSDWATTAPGDAVSCTSYGGTWTGSACIGIHTDNQNSWSTFSTAGSGLDTSGTAGQVTEVPTPQQWLQTDDSTSDRGFRAGDYTTTAFATVSGFGDDADVTLSPVDNGDGSDGAFNSATYNGVSIPGITGTSPSITINTNEASHLGVYNFTDFKVAAGDTVTVTGGHPLMLYVLVDTQIDGTLSASASGRSGRAGGGNGGNGANDGVGVGPAGVGGGGVADPGNISAGGGGGGHAVAGADGTSPDAVTYPPGLGGEAYGDDTLSTLYGGSGGGGNYLTGDLTDCSHSNPTGGGGGGIILIQSGASISVTGLVAANGAAGSNYYHRQAFGSCGGYSKGPGGGGAGGSIKLVATTIVLVDGGTRVQAVGGSGGLVGSTKRGGDGGGGRIRLEANNLQGQSNANAGTGTVTNAALSTALISSGSGTYTSHVQYMGNVDGSIASPGVWNTLSWNEDVPSGTTLAVSVHSCAASDCSDRGPTDWSPVVNGQDLSALTFVDDGHAYIQYKVDMSTTGGALPRLHDLAINSISYGGGVWFQSDDSTGDTGFNKTGFSTSNTLVVGSGNGASVILGGLAAGTGADGDFDSASYDGSSIAGITGVAPNIIIDTDEVGHGGVYNFSTFTVRQGDTVRVKGSNAFILKSLGDVTVNGMLNAKGYSGDAGGNNGAGGPAGSAGGAGCSDGTGLGTGGGVAADNSAGGGGGGHATAGSDGETSYTVAGGAGGLTYGDSALPTLEGGSGGGGSAVPSGTCADAAYGGGGGGAVQISSGGSLIVGTVGLISVDGGAGGSKGYSDIYAGGGGGGGAAGSLKVDADQIILNNPGASLSARGGQGGTSYFFGDGGDGGDGRIHLTAYAVQGSASINVGSGTLVNEARTGSTPVNGGYTSAIYDAGYPVSWEPIYWVISTPTGTTLSISVHSCALSDCSDRGPSDWSVASNSQDLSSLAYVDDGHQYIQYRVDMTSDGLVPRLDSLAINLKQDMGGSALVSSVYDTEDNANQIVALEWTADTSGPGTAVQFQLRTSPDGVSWGPWYGPTSTTDFYTVSGSTINAVHADGVDDRYVQYKAVLINTNPEYTPVLQDVTLKYITFGSGAVVSSGGSFGSGAASSNVAATESSGGGGALGTAFLVILLLGTAVSAGRHRQLGLKGVVLLAVTGTTTTAYAEFVLNFSTAGPVSGGAYKTYTVGDINSDFYQEFIIQKGFGQWQGDTGTASGGSRANSTDPLGFGGTGLSGTGNATGNPSKVIIWQRNRSSDMLLDFLKDDFSKKPRIIQSVVTNDMVSEFSVDMRGLSYSDNTTVAPVINTLSLSGQAGFPAPGQSLKWDMATDAQQTQIDAGQYTYTPGGGPGGSIGTYNYNQGNFDINSTDWSTFFDKNDSSNVWTTSTNKPN